MFFGISSSSLLLCDRGQFESHFSDTYLRSAIPANFSRFLQICFLQVFAVPPDPATSGSESSFLPREEGATMATSNSDHDSTQYEKTGHVAQHVVDVGDAAAQGHLATDQ